MNVASTKARIKNIADKTDVWDNLMRIKNADVAAELLEISLR